VIFEAMNPILLACLGVAAIAVLPPETVREVVATASATLFESTPFILAAALAGRFAHARRALPLLGCGCGSGPAARSLPAALATWLAFGPWVALARWLAAMALGRWLDRGECGHGEAGSALDALAGLVPYALIAGAVAHLLALVGTSLPGGAAGVAIGAVVGFALAPCGLGVVGIAGALRAVAPASALGFLCVAGVADARAFARTHVHGAYHDGTAYALVAIACAFVASRNGAALVHPRFTIALYACAIVFAALAWLHRRSHELRAAIAPALMCVALVLGAPAPPYRATATTLADAFAGEPLAFAGVVSRHDGATALVRYAITCCRADAAPIVVRLTRDVDARDGTWVSASGDLVDRAGQLQLRVDRAEPLAPPSDPFLYR
jgi:hypothetical protein